MEGTQEIRYGQDIDPLKAIDPGPSINAKNALNLFPCAQSAQRGTFIKI
jgi:hypothetical protein